MEGRLYLKPEKCEFRKETVSYLGLIISTKGISMDEGKLETAMIWSRETKEKHGRLNNSFEGQQFYRSCTYYRAFIPKYSENV